MSVLVLAAVAGFATVARAQPGSVNDLYIISDTQNEIYQFERNGTYVPGTFPGGAKPLVFSNSGQVRPISAYTGAFGGLNNNFFIGGFGGVTEVDGDTGAFVRAYNNFRAEGVDVNPYNNNLLTGGPGGMQEYNTSTGTLLRVIPTAAGNDALMRVRFNDVWVAQWNSAAYGIERRDYATGNVISTISVPFGPHEIDFGPDGNLYATALYESDAATTGVWKYDFSTSNWSLFAAASAAGGTGSYPNGPHCFAFDPINGDLLTAFADGNIHRYDGVTGAYLNQFGFVNTKLTDILFKPVPTPGTLALIGLSGLAAGRRRRA